jgi:hypothetical protein
MIVSEMMNLLAQTIVYEKWGLVWKILLAQKIG